MNENKARTFYKVLSNKIFDVKFYFVCCVLFLGFFTTVNFAQNNSQKHSPCPAEENIGRAYSSGDKGNSLDTKFNDVSENKIKDTKNAPMRFISKPIGKYTEEAQKNCVEGIVLLRITFLASGKIGKIKVLEGLAHGLSERAIEAAHLIKFIPEIKNGKPKTVTRKVSYNFTIY